MVRLKAKPGKYRTVDISSFQFQYGSIKSLRQPGDNKQESLFQFQYGSIKSLATTVDTIVVFVVSIPIWFD